MTARTVAGELAGKVALITGGTSGIGLAVARRFIAEGAHVVILARDLMELKQEPTDFKDSVTLIQGDVRCSVDNQKAVGAALAKYGKLDILVANAGIYDNRMSLLEYDPDQLEAGFDELFGIDVKGYMLSARAAMAELVRSKGVILFTGSVSSVSAGFGGALYVAAKHAVAGLTKQLAYELSPRGVRVNCVAPGYAPTSLRGIEALEQGRTRTGPQADALPLRVFASPDDYSSAYVLFASEAGRRMATGTVLVLDGGSSQTGPGPFLCSPREVASDAS